MSDITKKLLNDLADAYQDGANNIGAQADLTTWMARKVAQDRQLSTSNPEVVVYDGSDITPDVRTYLNGVAD